MPLAEYLIYPWFPKVSYGLIASQGGHGKSTCALQACIALATGLPFLGRPVSKICGTGMLCLEDDLATIHRRIAATVASYGSVFTEEHHRLLDVNFKIITKRAVDLAALTAKGVDLNLLGLAEEIAATMKMSEAMPGFLVIDTLNAVHDGDENSATESRPLIACVMALSETIECSVWLLHHYRKSGSGKYSIPLADRMDLELVRGSGAITTGLRGAFQMAWVTEKDAARGSISDWKGQHQYAVVGLTKFSNDVLPPWELWVHGAGGIWVPVAGGEGIIAKMIGQEGGQAGPTNRGRVILALLHAQEQEKRFDRLLAPRLCIGAKNPAASLRAVLGALRKDGLLKDDDLLTPKGLSLARTIAKGRPASHLVV